MLVIIDIIVAQFVEWQVLTGHLAVWVDDGDRLRAISGAAVPGVLSALLPRAALALLSTSCQRDCLAAA